MLTADELTVDGIVAEAAVRTGADPAGFAFLDGLGRLADSLNSQGRLTPGGRGAVRAALVGSLATQAALDELCRRYPEIERQPVVRPVFILGLLRTGTTLLHNLLAQHPGMRVPQLWELMNPATPRLDATGYQRLADAAQSYVDDYNRLVPTLKAIHFLDARRPDECHRLVGNTFHSMVYEMRYRVPDFGAWLADRDLTEAYGYHRRQVRALAWRMPGNPLVFKCPFHLWSLRELLAVYPDARVVQLHRSPTETVPSTCSLCAAIRGARSDRVDHAEIGRYWLARIEAGLAANAEARSRVPAGQLLDVRYADLVADPVGTAARVCDFAGAPLTGEAEAAMRRYLDGNGQTRHGVHRYRPEDFGLDLADLDRRFAGYRDQFGC
jgi:Sulfotransferase family